MYVDTPPTSPQQILSNTFITLLIIAVICSVMFAIWRKCHFGSSLLKTCFPLYLVSKYHCGICQADIFVEVTRIRDCKFMWAHYAQIAVHPTMITRIGTL